MSEGKALDPSWKRHTRPRPAPSPSPPFFRIPLSFHPHTPSPTRLPAPLLPNPGPPAPSASHPTLPSPHAPVSPRHRMLFLKAMDPTSPGSSSTSAWGGRGREAGASSQEGATQRGLNEAKETARSIDPTANNRRATNDRRQNTCIHQARPLIMTGMGDPEQGARILLPHLRRAAPAVLHRHPAVFDALGVGLDGDVAG